MDAQGTIIAQHSQGYRVDTPKVRWAEQWPQVWLDAVETCVAQCMAKAGVPASQVKALCISSLYGGSGIAVDARDDAAAPVPDLDGPPRRRAGGLGA